MLKLKKYANGRFYDTVNKTYVTKDQLSKLIEKKEKIQVVLAKTGKDVTPSVVSSLSASNKSKKNSKMMPILDTTAMKKRVEGNKKWIAKQIGKGMDTMMEMMSFPNKRQITKLNADVTKLSKKIDDLQIRHAKARRKMKLAHQKEMETLARRYDEPAMPVETESAAQTA